MCAISKMEVPDGLDEEYYQINQDILGSFNKYRPPLNIFRFQEDVARVIPFFKVGQRLSNEKVQELAKLVGEGLVFVSRDDHPVYVKHISYQLDLVLVDKHLKEAEIADIFVQALTRRMGEFLDQPVPLVLQKLWADLMVLTEYLFQDIFRVKALVRRLALEHSLASHSVNCGFVGLALYTRLRANDFEEGLVKRQVFDRLAAGLFLHDMGMTRIPAFIRDKTKPLVPDERTKIQAHPKLGYEMLAKLDLKYPEVEQCVLEHHERVGGKGYPMRKSGPEIGEYGALCAVVDSYCAMITKRPYAEAMKPLDAAAALVKDRGYDSRAASHLQAFVVECAKFK
ncbi:MAG: HD domain-containing protein [Desulfovibrionaceae bacterium]|nr:HD domain-containing protein [Desulfovibrionaceae bacterium]MDD4951604.1 HD domain-containing protein [Desulfovibrionaceae bacterium]